MSYKEDQETKKVKKKIISVTTMFLIMVTYFASDSVLLCG
jgi:hypothetical protein